MVLVLLFCAIIIVIMLLVIFTLISTVKIKINNLKIENQKKINSKYEISISLNLMNKLKWISIKLNKQKIIDHIKNCRIYNSATIFYLNPFTIFFYIYLFNE